MSKTIHEIRQDQSKHLNDIFNEIVKVLRIDRMVEYLSKTLNRINKWLKAKLSKWVLGNYPFQSTTHVTIDHYDTVLIKKGKIKEWRTFKDGVRQAVVMK